MNEKTETELDVLRDIRAGIKSLEKAQIVAAKAEVINMTMGVSIMKASGADRASVAAIEARIAELAEDMKQL